MRRINLLPSEDRRGISDRLPNGGAGILLVSGAVALVLMVGLYLILFLRLGAIEDQVAELDQNIVEQNARLDSLAPYRDLQSRLEAKKPVADGIFRTRFPWDLFLQGLSFVIPDTTALETMTGEAAPVDLDAPTEQPLDPPGAVTFTGVALPRYMNVADFVVRMNNLSYLSNSELDSAELDRENFARPAINFQVASELITVVGENGTEVRIDGATAAEVAAGGENLELEEMSGVVSGSSAGPEARGAP